MSNTAYLSLGSNIKPRTNLIAAVQMLGAMTKLIAVSPVWETKPVGLTDQPNFLNAATVIKTDFSAEQLIENVIYRIEQRLGRVRQANKNAPRPIDIDLILFNRQIFKLGHRHIPSPELLERPFVAIPLARIAPDYRHPETGQTLSDIARHFKVKVEEMRLRPNISRTLMKF